MQKESIKIEGHRGTWYVIGESYHNSERVYLLESERYGDEAPCLIVNRALMVLRDDVQNGFDELDY